MIEVRPLAPDELAIAGARLPLSRLKQPGGEYLVAWEGPDPVGHAHLDWRLDPPELQDVFVPEPLRRRGIASALSAAAERRAASRGLGRIALVVSEGNAASRALFEKLGYRGTGDPPRRVKGTIMLRGGPLEVDEILVRLEKEL